MKTQIPIYRAKKIDSDEYVEGYLYGDTIDYIQGNDMRGSQDQYNLKEIEYYIMNSTQFNNDLIDPSTLAIHFPDMIDSEGNKIFASLSEDGKGGDLLKSLRGKTARLIYKENTIQWDIYNVTFSKNPEFGICSIGHMKLSKVIGIQQ